MIDSQEKALTLTEMIYEIKTSLLSLFTKDDDIQREKLLLEKERVIEIIKNDNEVIEELKQISEEDVEDFAKGVKLSQFIESLIERQQPKLIGNSNGR